MDQEKPKRVSQAYYNGRWVDKEFFRTFVYNGTEQRLAKTYKEYEELIGTGLWFDSRELANKVKSIKLEEVTKENYTPQVPSSEIYDFKKVKARKPKHGTNSQTVPN